MTKALQLSAPVHHPSLPWPNPLLTSVFDAWCDLRVFARPVVVARHLGPSYTFDLTLCQHGLIACWDIDYTGWAAQAAHLVLSHNGFARAFPSPEHYTQLKALILELVCKAVVEYTP